MKKFEIFTLTAISILLIFTSCNKEEETKLVGAFIGVGINVSIKNNLGEDLLDPNNPNAFNENDIKVYYLIDGEMIEVFDPLMDYPRNFKIFKNESDFRVRIFLDHSTDKTTTYIKWNDSEIDEIKADIYTTENHISYSKAWYNSDLVCEDARGGCYYEIIK